MTIGKLERALNDGTISAQDMRAVRWQLERLDCTRDENGEWIEGEPSLRDAAAVLDEIEGN